MFFSLALIKPLAAVARFVFRHLLVPLYRVYFNLKQWLASILAPAKNKIFYPLLAKSTIHLVIVGVALAVVINNFVIKEIGAEEIGQKTVLAAIVQSPEEADIIETAVPETARGADYYRDAGVVTAGSNNQSELAAEITAEEGKIMKSESSAALVKPGLASTTVGSRPREQVIYYIVEGGDTVSTIAKKFNVSTNTLLWENRLGPRDYIKPGDKLTILPFSGVSHQVKKGDTIEKIAQRYEVEVNNLLEYNKLADASAIETNQILLIPGGTMPEEPKPQPPASTSSRFALFDIPPSATVTGAKLQWPTTGHKISQYFKWRHTGIDISGNYSSPIYAADDGRAEAVGWGSGYGNRVIVNHGNGLKTLYGHASKLFVSTGDSIKRGQVIGMIGCTGWCTGAHVHFEVIVNGSKVNPLSYL